MIQSIVYFLPCLVALLWLVSFSFKVKTQGQTVYMWTEMASVLYFAAFGIYLYPDTDYYMMVRMESICLPAGLIMAACLVVYLQMLRTKAKMNTSLLWCLIMPAIVEGTALALLYGILGFEDAAELGAAADKVGHLPRHMYSSLNAAYCIIADTAYNGIAAAYLLLIFLSCIQILHKEHYRPDHTWQFLFKGMKASYPRLIAIEVILLYASLSTMLYPGRLFITKHPELGIAIAILVAVLKHCLSHTVYNSADGSPVSLYELSHLGNREAEKMPELVPTQVSATASEVSPASESMELTEESHPGKEAHITKSNLVLIGKFKTMMEVDKIWKDENLNMSILCDMLGVGRTTLSTLLNMEYGMPFRDIVNRYRIDEAKNYLRRNPKATQEVVAEHCGFRNAQYLNTKFKQIVGETPMIWIASQHD